MDRDKSANKLKRQRILNIIEKAFNFILGIAGFFIGVYGLLIKDTIEAHIVITLMIITSLYLIIVTVHEMYLHTKNIDIIREKRGLQELITNEKEKYQHLVEDNKIYEEEQIDKIKSIASYQYYCSSHTRKHIELARKIKKEYKNELTELDEDISRMTFDCDEAKEKYIHNKTSRILDKFSNDFSSLYNRYLGNIINNLVLAMNTQINIQGYSLMTTSSVKHLSEKLVYDINNANKMVDTSKIKVYTFFRDSNTRVEGKREIQTNPYTINGNTCFRNCLYRKYFYFNNVKDNDKNFDNEHKGFNEFYNSGIIAPIISDTCLYGFLTCDVLNPLFEGEIFNDATGFIISSFAQQISLLLEYIDELWTNSKMEDTYGNFSIMRYEKYFKN